MGRVFLKEIISENSSFATFRTFHIIPFGHVTVDTGRITSFAGFCIVAVCSYLTGHDLHDVNKTSGKAPLLTFFMDGFSVLYLTTTDPSIDL